MNRRFALIGHPVAGSLSPRMMAAAYGGRYRYDLLDFAHFEDAWKAFQEGYYGINVTAPFKQDAYARVDSLSAQAKATGAVNLVVPHEGGYRGYNTDVDGVVEALRETGLSFRHCLIVGTGGAARAAVHAATLLGCGKVCATGRSLEKAAALGCEAVSLAEAAHLRPDLLIYTLPGRVPVPEGLPFAQAVVLEAEYRIPQLRAVSCRRYVGGERWLLWQAAAGYRLFTGEEPQVQEMLRAL